MFSGEVNNSLADEARQFSSCARALADEVKEHLLKVFIQKMKSIKIDNRGTSPGLMVVGGDSCSESRGFESQHCMPDGHFSHLFDVKIVMFEQTK